MTIEFSAHNILLDDGTFTRPEIQFSIKHHAWFISAQRILETVFPGDKKHLRLADLGCLEGGYSVEFARMGFQVLGVEVRDVNIAACNYVKSKTNLPNLTFVKDNALNIANHGVFDTIFCCGLLYHLDAPKQFLETLSKVTKKLLILQTHFSTDTATTSRQSKILTWLEKILAKPAINQGEDKFHLSQISENEGLPGRWYQEYKSDEAFSNRENAKWASWENRRSFWIQREYLLQAIKDVGFDLVVEQFDSLVPNIAESMLHGNYRTTNRGTFIGIKT